MQRTIILSRPAWLSEKFARQLTPVDGGVILSPVMAIVPELIQARIDDAAILILTSQNAVRAASDAIELKGRRAYAAGQATADMAREAGLDLIATSDDAQTLVARIIAERPNGKLIHIRGRHVSVDVASSLKNAGLEADYDIRYGQDRLPLTPAALGALGCGGDVILPLFSPRSARILAAQLAEGTLRAAVHLVSISAAVNAAWSKPAPASRSIAASPDADAMIKGIRHQIAQLG